jgi:hypothetical protein
MTGDASTERLLLEPWSDSYFEEFARVLQDLEAMRFISGGTPLPLETIRSIAQRGLATEGAREAIRFGWARTRLPRIISATAAGHLASRRVMEKCGLVFQGEIAFRTARVAWYAIDRPDRGPRLAHQPLACPKPALGSRSILPV